MHILLHTQYYPPEIGAPQMRLHELALGLTRHGFQITVLTAMPSYPRGRIYEGYAGWLQVECIDGIKVIRTAIYPTQSLDMLPRLISYFSFILTSLVIGLWKMDKVDVVITESPPLFLGMAGLLLSCLIRARWIFNISDLWPESAVELGIVSQASPGYKISSALEKYLYNRAWIVSGQSRTIIENIQERFPDLRVYYLPNGVDTIFFQPGDIKSENKYFHVVYAGLHGLAQGLDQILCAAQKLPSTERIDFTFIGDGPEKRRLIQLAKDLNLKHIHFLEPVTKEEIPAILRTADILIVPLKIQLTGAVPSKLYEAMAIGKPVILIAGSEAAQIVNEANCGMVVRPGNIDGLVAAIDYLKTHPEIRNQMGVNGRQAVVQNHNRTRTIDEFALFLTLSE